MDVPPPASEVLDESQQGEPTFKQLNELVSKLRKRYHPVEESRLRILVWHVQCGRCGPYIGVLGGVVAVLRRSHNPDIVVLLAYTDPRDRSHGPDVVTPPGLHSLPGPSMGFHVQDVTEDVRRRRVPGSDRTHSSGSPVGVVVSGFDRLTGSPGCRYGGPTPLGTFPGCRLSCPWRALSETRRESKRALPLPKK